MNNRVNKNGSDKNNAAKETISLMLKLGIICIAVAGLLAIVNNITLPIIQENNEKNFNSSVREVIDGDTFEEVKADFSSAISETGVEVESVYAAKTDGNLTGFAVTAVCHEGYGGDIQVMVGIVEDDESNKPTVKSVKIMSMSETAGLGAKANNAEFTDGYKGLNFGISVVKNGGGSKADNSVSAISGATVTSKAVTKAVNCCLKAAEVALSGGTAR